MPPKLLGCTYHTENIARVGFLHFLHFLWPGHWRLPGRNGRKYTFRCPGIIAYILRCSEQKEPRRANFRPLGDIPSGRFSSWASSDMLRQEISAVPKVAESCLVVVIMITSVANLLGKSTMDKSILPPCPHIANYSRPECIMDCTKGKNTG